MQRERKAARLVVAACLTATALASGGAAPLRAQLLPETGSGAARDAQRRFERFRRDHLPVAFGGTGPCEVQVGRYCYWNGDEDEPPAEPAAIGRERRRLIETLRARASTDAADGWSAGQLVRYLLEEGRMADALAAARACGGEAWWCAALRGYALHRAGDDSAATSAYDSALAAMPDSTRCHWTDVSLWLEGDAEKRYEKLDCGERERLARRTWWLARPLLVARPGDEARAEFLARRTVAALYATSAIPHSERWGDDIEEIGLRYGWPTAWARNEAPGVGLNTPAPTTVIGYEPRPARAFAAADPTDSTGGGWSLNARIARSRFAPSYADSIVALGHQLARFRRGDSCVVVAAYDGGAPQSWGAGPLRAGLALAAGPDSLLAAARRDDATPRGTLTVTAARARGLVAVELYGPAARRAARARYAFAPLDSGAAISDLLLVDAARFERDAANAELADVLPDAKGNATVVSGDRVALFWESYVAPREDAPITVSLTIFPTSMSLARKFAVALHFAERPTPVTLKWDDSGRPAGPAGHIIVLHTDGMPEGKYRLELALRREGTELGVAKRDMTVR